jgi:hypothetical protein
MIARVNIEQFIDNFIFIVINAKLAILGIKKIFSNVKIVSHVIKASNQTIFIANIVRNAMKDLNRIHFIVLRIISVILALKGIYIVNNVKAVIKSL